MWGLSICQDLELGGYKVGVGWPGLETEASSSHDAISVGCVLADTDGGGGQVTIARHLEDSGL